MKKKIQRRGLVTSVKELRKLADSMSKELVDTHIINGEKLVGFKDSTKIKFQLNIINKKGASDTWEFEK